MDLPSCSGAPSNDATVPSASTETPPVASVNKNSGDINAAYAEGSHCRIFEKNQVPFKSNAPGWFGSSRAHSDLVIRFSDDDSGSDSEESRQGKTLESKGRPPGVTGNKKLLAPVRKKMEMIHQTIRSRTKPMPKKMSLSRTFISSMTKSRGTNPGNVGSSVWRGSRVRKFNTLNKNKYVAQPEHASNQGMVLNTSKLQDLRQQIAMREKELKLKSAQQNKERLSGLDKDDSVMNLKNNASGKTKVTSTDIEQSDSDESDRKCIKVNEACSSQMKLKELPSSNSVVASKELGIDKKGMKLNGLCSNQLNLEVCQDISTSKSVTTAKVPVFEDCGLQEKNMVDHSYCGKEIPIGRTMPSTVKWQKQDDKVGSASKGSLPSGGKEGGDMIASCSQSERSSRLLDPLVRNQTAPSSNVSSKTLLRRSSAMESRHPNKAAHEQSCMKSSENREVIFGGKTLMPALDNSFLARFIRVPDRKMEGSLNATTLRNHLDEVNIPACGSIDVQSLEELEEMQERELEEAQEHRWRCEIEERNALKAYRKAQRDLIEANSRCTYFYSQRELYSAQFRSLILDDSNLLFSSGQQNHIGAGLNPSNNVSKTDADLVPTLNHQMRGEFNNYNELAYDSAVQFAEGALLNASDRNVDGQNSGSEACSEPDVSTSELLPEKLCNRANGVCSPSIDHGISEDEDEETYSSGLGSVQPDLEFQRNVESYKEREEDINDESKIGLPVDSSQDSLLLEESLRSELFARLGKRSSKNIGPAQVVEPTVESLPPNDISEKSRMSMDNEVCSEAENNQHSDQEGSAQHSDHEEENRLCISDDHWSPTTISISPILRSGFSHLKVASTISFTEMHDRDKHEGTSGIYNGEVIYASYDKVQLRPRVLRGNSLQQTVRDRSVGENGSYMRNSVIDPFWPLCMYELRGKCNNEECPWQHVKEYSSSEDQHDGSNSADSCAGSLPLQRKLTGATKFSKCLNSHVVLSPPTYLVSLDILKADLHAYESVLVQSIGRCWQKCFSTSLDVTSLLGREFASNGPCLLGADSRIEVHGSLNRLSLYFQSRHGKVNQIKSGLVDSDQTLEMVFLSLNQGVNKSEGTSKALETLSRALEADPTSIILWVVYLHIFYSDKMSVGKDDMFFYAIKHNEGCYELWLMYINSRMQLDDRFAAYDTALSALCCNASAPVTDVIYASGCILDLFLQMMDCFCMSGNVEKVIHRICGLFLNAKYSDSGQSLLLSDVLKCLTISDKCIFWVCCIYLVIYRKLPNEIAQQFEFFKELSAIGWPPVNLTIDDKQQAIKLMEVAISSVALCIDVESTGSDPAHTSLHMLAVNHIRCITALSGLECSQNLLARYTQVYPLCLELVMMSARAQKNGSGDLRFVGFEEAISNWPKEVPGIQCIWNQYAEYLLQNGRSDFAKELMVRWKVQYTHDGVLNIMDCDVDYSHGSLEAASALIFNSSISDSNHMDAMFGFLNLCLYRLLQNDHQEAQLAIDRALKVAAPKEFTHCVREHAMFLLTNGPQLEEDVSTNRILNILKGYLFDNRAFRGSVLLSRKFIQDIKKPRVHQLMNSILNPISRNFSLVNLVLEVLYGPSLLPQQFSRLKSLVDFVEAIMEISPSNYQLAISVCKLLSGGSKPDDVIPANVLFWATSLLVNAIFQAVPVAPEYVWAEAAGILSSLTDIQALSESFHNRALSVYPFSIKLWKSCLNLSKISGSVSDVVGAAIKRGIILD